MNFSTLTVKQLKEELRKRNLPVSGVKAVLIQRLQNYEQSASTFSSSSSSSSSLSSSSSSSLSSSSLIPRKITRKELNNLFRAYIHQNNSKLAIKVGKKLNMPSDLSIYLIDLLTQEKDDMKKNVYVETICGILSKQPIFILNPVLIKSCTHCTSIFMRKIVDFCIENGANWFLSALVACGSTGDIELIESFIHKVESIPYQKIVEMAILNGHYHVYEYFCHQSLDLKRLFIRAITGGHYDIMINFMMQLDSNDRPYNQGLIEACAEGHTQIVTQLLELMDKETIDYDSAIFEAQEASRLDIVEILAAYQGKTPSNKLLPPPTLQNQEEKEIETIEID